MNKAQIRHTQSIGRHLNVHIQSMKYIADNLEKLTERDGATLPANWTERQLNDLAHYWTRMERVVEDMLPGFEEMK